MAGNQHGAQRVSLDRHTILAAQAGDPGSVNRVLTACEGVVLHVARRHKPWQPGGTDDREQAARIDIWVHALPKWQRDGAAFKTHAFWWARSGSSKEAKKEARLKAKERTESELWPDPEEGQEHSPLDVQRCCYRLYAGMVEGKGQELDEVREVLFDCVRKLTQEEQRVLHWVFWLGMTVREVADMTKDPSYGVEPMGKTKVVDVRNRALERLKGMLIAKEFETWL